MNLNPLKKDDNTDALVKALEDANTMGGTSVPTPAAPVTDGAAIAADPQVVSAGAITQDTANVVGMADMNIGGSEDSTAPTLTDTPSADPATDTASGIAFSGNDLPAGLSSDADAHLGTEGSGENGELDGVKKSALEQLRPLIEKLDLEPADKFDKYLMMLRASDDAALIKPAFDAAQGIEGEKEKAQALLDIINEINYITASKQG
ncbi:hypothetical protein KBD20_01320 [Candidatus Saccharibacteria bacterium]|nr:hypothetical protein [Candidatus Saccharibacteria bacterium]